MASSERQDPHGTPQLISTTVCFVQYTGVLTIQFPINSESGREHTGLLEDLGEDGHRGVDGVADDGHPGAWAVLCNAIRQACHNACRTVRSHSEIKALGFRLYPASYALIEP